jgi:GNAT superfamily N-acetyltransferase
LRSYGDEVAIIVDRLTGEDRSDWELLFRSYISFYNRVLPQHMYDRAWTEFQTDKRMHARGAKIAGRLVGIVHFLVHPNTSAADVCYLQDLFTAPEARGQGIARTLIQAVADWAATQGCDRVYWSTHQDNTAARALYDRIAEHRGFILYRMDVSNRPKGTVSRTVFPTVG